MLDFLFKARKEFLYFLVNQFRTKQELNNCISSGRKKKKTRRKPLWNTQDLPPLLEAHTPMKTNFSIFPYIGESEQCSILSTAQRPGPH